MSNLKDAEGQTTSKGCKTAFGIVLHRRRIVNACRGNDPLPVVKAHKTISFRAK